MTRLIFVFIALFHLRAVTSVSGEEYFIDILPNKDSTKLIFRIKKRVKQSKLDKDTNIIRIIETVKSVKKFGFNNDTVKTNLAKLDSLNRIYTIYETDSLLISNSKNEAYLELIHEVLNTKAEILENNNNKRFVLDGVTMIFKLTNNGNSQAVYVRSPTLTSNPLLYQVVTETKTLYRLNKKNGILNKYRTFGF